MSENLARAHRFSKIHRRDRLEETSKRRETLPVMLPIMTEVRQRVVQAAHVEPKFVSGVVMGVDIQYSSLINELDGMA